MHRVNVMLNDEVWEQLNEIPKGERSELINEAVAEALQRKLRQEAFGRMRERAKTKMPLPGGTEDWIREDRDTHL